MFHFLILLKQKMGSWYKTLFSFQITEKRSVVPGQAARLQTGICVKMGMQCWCQCQCWKRPFNEPQKEGCNTGFSMSPAVSSLAQEDHFLKKALGSLSLNISPAILINTGSRFFAPGNLSVTALARKAAS